MIVPGSANLLLAGADEGYKISRSLRFNSADSAYLNRTFGSPTNAKKWTYSLWVKGSPWTNAKLLAICTSGSSDAQIYLTGGQVQISSYNGVGTDYTVRTDAVYRDPSSWYHFVFVYDTDNGTSANRAIIYVNGVRQSVTTPNNGMFPSGYSHLFNTNGAVTFIGARPTFFDGYLDGYLTEINFVDGQALTPSSFGQTNASTGVWEPIAYTGTYGNNGFYLNFSDNSGTTSTTLGKDNSGNGNNWTPNLFSVTAGAGNDSLVDTPTSYGTDTGVGGEVRGNYCTLNPLFTNQTGISSGNTGTVTITNGNLTVVPTSTSIAGAVGTLGVSSGKWYFEYTITTASVNGDVAGFITSFSGANTTWIGYRTTGVIYNNGSSTSGYATATAGDIIGIALDIGGSTISCYKNNTLLATTALNTAITADCFPLIWFRNDTGSGSVNFGQRPFAYTAPSGFKALCTQNLPTPTIGATSTTQAGKYFNTVLYTGIASSLSVTGVGFQPDLVWIKNRPQTVSHFLTDVLRGAGKRLYSDADSSEADQSTDFTAFNSDGFTVAGNNSGCSAAQNYVAWNWKANGAGSSNTAGSITSTVSANTTAGFSIVTYTGTGTAATVGHGLGVAPSLIIVKVRANGGANTAWHVYSSVLGNGSYLVLNTTAASDTGSIWNSTSPTSTVFSIGSSTWPQVNNNTGTYVAYCFAAVAGYSAFGSYTGNGSSDGPFVYTGFRPKFIMQKKTSGLGEWVIWDTSRSTYNFAGPYLYANSSAAEGASAEYLDILSNGFKWRSNNTTINGSGATNIFIAFAENPFKYSLAR